jgi:tRNA (guanine-N7-)-methyltransferase
MSSGTERGDERRAFFGRRKGHRLRAQQAQLFDQLLPQLALDLTAPSRQLESLFFHSPQQVRLEIGFGGGEHLIAQAAENPNIGFIGCEPYANGMAKALAAIAAGGLTNVRLHFGDAVDLLAWLPPRALWRVSLLYPDPWPKRRHWKRRFVQAARLGKLAAMLRPGGEFRFASDIPDYAAWTLALFLRSGDFEWMAECADDWRQPWPDYRPTRYEAKAVREGRTPCYLTFRRK